MSGVRITSAAIDTMTGYVADWGARRVETGGFLLADAERPNAIIDTVALAASAGIVRQRLLFGVSGGAIGQLFDWAADSGLRICAQVHSHQGDAFLSRTDLKHGFAVEGFTTAVVPFFADPSRDPQRWGWWSFRDGSWQSCPPPAPVAGRVRVVHFDERGIRAA